MEPRVVRADEDDVTRLGVVGASGALEKDGDKDKRKLPDVKLADKSKLVNRRTLQRMKKDDLNAFDVEAAKKIIAGTARSMGLEVEG